MSDGKEAGPEVGGGDAFFAQSPQAERGKSFSEALPRGVANERAVKPVGRLPIESTVKKKLSGGGHEEIGSAHDLGDTHEVIVGDNCHFVGGKAIAAPDKEVAKVVPGSERLAAEMAVFEVEGFAVGDAKTPVY